MEIFWLVIWALVAGIIIGPLARLVIPGKQDIGLLATILIGAAGALIGGFIYRAFGGGETGGIDWILLLVEVASAAVLVLIWVSMKGTKTNA
jgi:uncharacterized membrane protein YeaQ/YmgE (transglycosylase-associated protein family)